MNNKNALYLQNFIWKRLSDQQCIRYVVLTNIDTNMHAIQSADFFRLGEPSSTEYFDRQFVDLLAEVDPQERCTWHSSIAEAINIHNSDFESI
jgi:uncharacterized protein YlbG (UPF0298 family)